MICIPSCSSGSKAKPSCFFSCFAISLWPTGRAFNAAMSVSHVGGGAVFSHTLSISVKQGSVWLPLSCLMTASVLGSILNAKPRLNQPALTSQSKSCTLDRFPNTRSTAGRNINNATDHSIYSHSGGPGLVSTSPEHRRREATTAMNT